MHTRYCVWLAAFAVLSLAACSDRTDAQPSPSASGSGNASTGGTSNPGNNVGGGSAGGESAQGGAGLGGSSAGAGAAGGVSACPVTQGLKVTRLDTTSVAMMGKPFDTDGDTTTPWGWGTNYGKPPEIVALPDGESVDILWQDHSADPARGQDDPNKNAKKAFLMRVEKGAAGYAVTRAYQIDQMAHIMGLARDESGNYYVATGVNEDKDLTPELPAPGMHRPGIVKIVKLDPNGCKTLEIDASAARQTADAESEPIINPMVAATSRLAYHDGRVALLHGINTDYDANPMVMSRHQKALTTHFDATSGGVTLGSSMWVSHSFDQRLFHDGTGFVEVHLGDAHPRAIVMGRFSGPKMGTKSYELFKPKGATGANDTYTRLGGVAQLATGDFGYIVAFTTERGTETAQSLNGTRDVALVRVSRAFATMDEKGNAFVDGAATQVVTSAGNEVTNKLTWLTDYAASMAQADRPRLAPIGQDRFVVLWERWTGTGDREATFGGLHGLVVGADGTVQVMAKHLSDQHLSRGDDVVGLGANALFVSGDGAAKKLTLNLIGADLSLTSVDLP
ncbi:MAG: hypothetical protein K0R38_1678 [Polyangiaceae bacterium]|jgi:hypothetical protein|nr:hypothetical protein [Polyangiaceae bacterium]